MSVSRVRNKGQVTIPSEVRDAAQIDEGTMVEFTVTEQGVLMRPKVQVLVDRADSWFYSANWQQRHQEAVAEIERGDGELHESADEFLTALDSD